ncbi:MAG: hypothetical protein PHN42_05500 [Bacilli bacterium]|nr:hypothetical protein [Bacilli bacterium]
MGLLQEIKKEDLNLLFLENDGSEAYIFKTTFNNKKYIYKEFKKRHSSINFYENKKNKLNEIYNLNLPVNIVKPSYMVKDNGYLMEYMDKTISLDDMLNIDINKKIEILSSIRNLIQYLNNNNIIYGDIKGNNILFDGIDPILIDIDNVITQKYIYDTETFFISEYKKRCDKLDLGLDKFNLNLFTYCFINNIYYFRQYQELIRENIFCDNYKNFSSDENIDIIKRLISFKTSYSDDLLINNLVKKKI